MAVVNHCEGSNTRATETNNVISLYMYYNGVTTTARHRVSDFIIYFNIFGLITVQTEMKHNRCSRFELY